VVLTRRGRSEDGRWWCLDLCLLLRRCRRRTKNNRSSESAAAVLFSASPSNTKYRRNTSVHQYAEAASSYSSCSFKLGTDTDPVMVPRVQCWCFVHSSRINRISLYNNNYNPYQVRFINNFVLYCHFDTRTAVFCTVVLHRWIILFFFSEDIEEIQIGSQIIKCVTLRYSSPSPLPRRRSCWEPVRPTQWRIARANGPGESYVTMFLILEFLLNNCEM